MSHPYSLLHVSNLSGRQTIEKLLPEVSSAVRAASILPSLSRVIEELVLNSLDAGSSNIEVKVNMTTFSFDVKDDGVGISPTDLRDKTGEWNVTSKLENSISHGFKGEALAAIRVLSSMAVTSKTSESCFTYIKSFDHHDNYELDKRTFELSRSHIVGSGTRVAVWQLFKRLPARRMSMRSHIELTKIKDLVQRMSILYHDVGWILIDDSTGRVIMNLKPQESVSARFSAFHGQLIQSKMKDISVSQGPFMLCGLLSPPISDCCHWTREYQYFYVNNRWMKGTASVINMIDKVFIAALTSQRSGGPASKHHNPKGSQVSPHPCFVLQLCCPSGSFDALSEPNKSKAVFTDPYRVKLCVRKLLLKMFEIYRPDLFVSADSLCCEYSNSPSTSYRFKVRNAARHGAENSDANQRDESGMKTNVIYGDTKLYSVRHNYLPGLQTFDSIDDTGVERRPQTIKTPDEIIFKSAFLESPPEKDISKGCFQTQPHSLFSEFEFSDTLEGAAASTVQSSDDVIDCSGKDHIRADSRDSDEEDSDDDEEGVSMNDNHGGIEDSVITGIGVKVSRLPGFVEYIDDQLDNFGSQPSIGSVNYLPNYDELEDLIIDQEDFSLIEFSSRNESHYEAVSKVDMDCFDSDYSLSCSDSQRSVDGERTYGTDPDGGKSDTGQSHIGDFCQVNDSAYDSCRFPLDPVQYTPEKHHESSIEMPGALTPQAQTLHSKGDCRIDLYNNVFNDVFFPADLDTSATESKHINVDIIIKKSKGTGISLGTKRSAVVNRRSSDSVSSILDDDFDSYQPNVKKIKQSILAPATVTTAMTLQRGMLSNLRCVGQVDSKYLLVVTGKLILMVDQHAADERVQLEHMLCSSKDGDTKKYTGLLGGKERDTGGIMTSISGTQAIRETFTLTESDFYTLTVRRKVFSDWKFLFDVIDTSNLNFLEGTCDIDSIKCNAAGDHLITVELTQVPIVFGEALTAQDFLEFIHSLSEHSKFMAPRSMLQPPCVKRIAASKACRTAVVFGDILSLTECQDMMVKLSKTSLPFQCAHGRPSVVPLLLLEQLKESNGDGNRSIARRNSRLTRTPTYSNILSNDS